MIRRAIHSTKIFAGKPAALDMRLGVVWNGSLCAGLEDLNYQQKPNGIGRTEQPD